MYFNLNSLRNEFDVIVENYERTSERFSLEESYDRAVCTAERNGLVGRPRIQVTEEQLTTLLFVSAKQIYMLSQTYRTVMLPYVNT